MGFFFFFTFSRSRQLSLLAGSLWPSPVRSGVAVGLLPQHALHGAEDHGGNSTGVEGQAAPHLDGTALKSEVYVVSCVDRPHRGLFSSALVHVSAMFWPTLHLCRHLLVPARRSALFFGCVNFSWAAVLSHMKAAPPPHPSRSATTTWLTWR